VGNAHPTSLFFASSIAKPIDPDPIGIRLLVAVRADIIHNHRQAQNPAMGDDRDPPKKARGKVNFLSL
jgi:hypothetical protein